MEHYSRLPREDSTKTVENEAVRGAYPVVSLKELTETRLHEDATDLWRAGILLLHITFFFYTSPTRIWVRSIAVDTLAGTDQFTLTLNKLCTTRVFSNGYQRYLQAPVPSFPYDPPPYSDPQRFSLNFTTEYPYTSLEFESTVLNAWEHPVCKSHRNNENSTLWPLFPEPFFSVPLNQVIKYLLSWAQVVSVFNFFVTSLRLIVPTPSWLRKADLLHTRVHLWVDTCFLILDVLLLLLDFLTAMTGEIFFTPVRAYLTTKTLHIIRGPAHYAVYGATIVTLLLVLASLNRIGLSQKTAVLWLFQSKLQSPLEVY